MHVRIQRMFRLLLLAALPVNICLLGGLGVAAPAQAITHAPAPPIQVGDLDVRPFFARLPDGRLIGCFIQDVSGSSEMDAIYSSDEGRTWSRPESLFKMPSDVGRIGLYLVFVDRHGELHLFFLNDAHSYAQRAAAVAAGKTTESVELHLDIWQAKSRNHRTEWQLPSMIYSGFASHLNSVIQLRSGRIVIPFASGTKRTWSNRGVGFDAYTFMGQYDCTTIYSDDDGETWHKSAAALKVETPDLRSYGAVEPVVLELKDGRVWMLIRTQKGRLWESYSSDGAVWSPPQPSRFLSSDSPAGLLRLDDGRIALFWNSCLRTSYDQGGRQVLHGAISADEGKTWRGFREVARDPRADEIPPKSGDWGTAYPFPISTGRGNILVRTGQGVGRNFLLLVNPAWLEETTRKSDFSSGLEDWSVFATKDVSLVDDPITPGQKVLSIDKPEGDWQAGAVWNFPMGASGRIRLKLLTKPGFQGALVGLTDHFSPPFDQEDTFYDEFNLVLGPSGSPLTPNQWHDLQIDWNIDTSKALLTVDGNLHSPLPLLRKGEGVNYLRLRALASSTDKAGFLVRDIDVDLAAAFKK